MDNVVNISDDVCRSDELIDKLQKNVEVLKESGEEVRSIVMIVLTEDGYRVSVSGNDSEVYRVYYHLNKLAQEIIEAD